MKVAYSCNMASKLKLLTVLSRMPNNGGFSSHISLYMGNIYINGKGLASERFVFILRLHINICLTEANPTMCSKVFTLNSNRNS